MINQEKSLLGRLLPHVAAILVFLAITLVYFSPLIKGQVLPQGDVTQYQGASRELREYYHNEGESSAWTGSMFSGMPAYQIGIWGGLPNFLDYLEKPLKALGSSSAGAVFAGMLMAYILFSVMGFRPVESILGAIAYSLSSYNIIILEAGHVTKAWALAYMPLIVAGMMALFKRKILLGGLLMALGLALQVKSNHLQITYYTGLLCAILYIGLVIDMISKKEISSLLKSSVVLVVALLLAGFSNAGNIYANLEMAKESTRGQSELSAPSTAEKQSSGLDKDYAFAWSYGKAETLSLMIPNVHGGASGGMLDNSSNLYKEMVKQGFGSQVGPEGIQSNTYWGAQPFTSGPVYFGAIIVFLFVFGMIIIRNKMKWALFIATVFFIFLAWGKNFESFNDLFFYHFPYYSKFRAVSTALVIPALTMVMIAVWGLKEFFSGEIDQSRLKKSLYISFGVVGGLSLFFAIAPGFFFNFIAESDASWKAQMPEWYYSALVADRRDLLASDAFRSFVFILLAAATLFILNMKAAKKYQLIGGMAIVVLVLIDLWNVDKRYLNDSNFKDKVAYQAESFVQSTADKFIFQDKDPSYRVLNLNNPFNETATSYHHKSIGGYHAAKLKRYQELIDHNLADEVGLLQNKANAYLQSEVAKLQSAADQQNIDPRNISIAVQDSMKSVFTNTAALNMLNARYVIYHPELPPLVNPEAQGNAWFVDKYVFVNNADEEIAALSTANREGHQAIVDVRFEDELKGLNIVPDSTATIVMTEYKPNRLKYKSKANSEQLAVMSEMYFANGWQAYIDGTPANHFRADWTLRAMRVPAGEHEIEFKFEPKGYDNARVLASASSAILVLLLLGMLGFGIFKKKEQ